MRCGWLRATSCLRIRKLSLPLTNGRASPLELSGPDLEAKMTILAGRWEGLFFLSFIQVYLASSWPQAIQTSLPITPADKLRTFNNGDYRDVTSTALSSLACYFGSALAAITSNYSVKSQLGDRSRSSWSLTPFHRLFVTSITANSSLTDRLSNSSHVPDVLQCSIDQRTSPAPKYM